MTSNALPGEMDARLEALLGASLEMWGIGGEVERNAAGGLVVRTSSADVRIARAPDALPFRWIVEGGGRERGAASVVGVLRHVRAALDQRWQPGRLRIAATPEAP